MQTKDKKKVTYFLINNNFF